MKRLHEMTPDEQSDLMKGLARHLASKLPPEDNEDGVCEFILILVDAKKHVQQSGNIHPAACEACLRRAADILRRKDWSGFKETKLDIDKPK